MTTAIAEAKVWTQDEIRTKLLTDSRWLARAIESLFENGQTSDEQNSEDTIHNNGIGFNGADGRLMSSFAKQIMAWKRDPNPRFSTPLSPRQVAKARERMVKYTRQLTELANRPKPR